MSRRLSLGFACLLTVVAATVVHAGVPIVITFDQDPMNNDIPNGTVIDNTYASLGIVFSATIPGSCEMGLGVYASSNCLDDLPPTYSTPNVQTLCPEKFCSDISEGSHGLIRATFDSPAEAVCVDFYGADPEDEGVLRAYDADNNLLQQHVAVGPAQLCVATVGIHHVEYSGHGDSYGWFDAIQFILTPVPVEPATFSSIKVRFN